MKTRQKKFSLFSILLIALTGISYGQKDLQAGYIIKNDGQEVHGKIDIQSNVSNSKSCLFQNKEQGTLESYGPHDIKGYKTTTKYYVSREIEIDSVKQTVFLEYLVDGIVDLFYLKEQTNEYYFVEKDSKIYQLENNALSVFIEGDGIEKGDKAYVKTSNRYKGTLNYLFSDAQGFSNRISQAPFHYRSLINLTKDYHNAVCNEYECIDYTRSSTQGMTLEISGGLIHSQMNLKTSETSVTNFRPALTAQLRFVPLKNKTHWIFLIGLSYSTNEFHGLFINDLYYASRNDTFNLNEKYTIIRLPLNIQYEFGSKKIQPVIFAGYSACLYLGAEYAAYYHSGNVDAPQNSDLRKFQHGFNGGLGIKYNLKNSNYFFIKGNFEYRIPSADLNYVFDYVRHTSIIVNFGYAFEI